jgi:hypothetical protein
LDNLAKNFFSEPLTGPKIALIMSVQRDVRYKRKQERVTHIFTSMIQISLNREKE